MLITLPDHDAATRYSSAWSREIIEIARRNGIDPQVLENKNVTRKHVEVTISEKNPQLLIFNGHGSDTIIGGHKNEPIIVFGENENFLKDRIIHAFTCSSGSILGKQCGAKAFIGYAGLFFLCMDGKSITRPLEDKLATPIMQAAIEAPKQLAKKKSAGEAYEKSQEKYEQLINEYTYTESKYTTEELVLVLPCLEWNKSCQILYGDKEAKVN